MDTTSPECFSEIIVHNGIGLMDLMSFILTLNLGCLFLESLNIYGDSSAGELSGYGIDISLQRTDSLDIALLH
jgi:hypothetical protein